MSFLNDHTNSSKGNSTSFFLAILEFLVFYCGIFQDGIQEFRFYIKDWMYWCYTRKFRYWPRFHTMVCENDWRRRVNSEWWTKNSEQPKKKRPCQLYKDKGDLQMLPSLQRAFALAYCRYYTPNSRMEYRNCNNQFCIHRYAYNICLDVRYLIA